MRFDPIAAAICALLGALASLSFAEEPSASKSTYLQLIEVQKLWEQERYGEAITDLEGLAAKVVDKPYDYAVVNQYLAHTSILSGDTAGAGKALEAALSVAASLPVETMAEINLFYGQIMLGEEEYEVARQAFDTWMANTADAPKPSHVFSAAYAHYRTGSLATAEDLVEQALAGVETPEENWQRLHYQVLFEREKYQEAEAVLLRMLESAPTDRGRWDMLSNHYLRLEDSERALAVLLLTHQQDLLEDPDDLRKLVSLYSYVEVPERAARMLEQWMREGVVETDPETLRQLGDLWMLARERAKAKEVLEQAAAVAPDGRTWELLGSIHFEDERWSEAYEAYANALEAGGLKEPHRVSLLAGLSAYRAGMKAEARSALEQAAQADSLRAQARGLLKRLDEV